MTTSPADSNSPDTISRSPHREAAQSEAGLRRVLAYLSEKPYRRWIAYALIFSIIYAALATVLSYSLTLLFPPFSPLGISFPNRAMLVFYGYASRLVPLAITVLILLKLRKIYSTR